jgi:lysozyme family protein
MKMIVALVLLILTPAVSSFDMPLEQKNKQPLLLKKKADFRVALNELMSHEGYYAFHLNDRGRETYSGITRRWNPEWYGWRYIDSRKRDLNRKWTLPTNHQVEEADFWVLDYYVSIWVREGFDQLENQKVANYIFDFRINASVRSIRLVQETLVEMGEKVVITKEMDDSTIKALNRVNSKVFLRILKKHRIAYYSTIAKRDKSQSKFLKHWIYRAQTSM